MPCISTGTRQNHEMIMIGQVASYGRPENAWWGMEGQRETNAPKEREKKEL